MKHPFRFPKLLLALLISLGTAAQATSVTATHVAIENRQQGQVLQAALQDQSARGQLAAAENEAAPTEENDQQSALKYSKAVKWIAHSTGLSVQSAYWMGTSVNFFIIAVFIVWAWRAQVPQAFRARTATIQKGIEEARRSSDEANRKLAEVQSRLAKLDVEISSIRASAESEGAAEEERISAALKDEERRIIESAQQEIEAASRQARRELKAYAAELAVSLAEKRIHVDAASDRALIGRVVEQLATAEERS